MEVRPLDLTLYEILNLFQMFLTHLLFSSPRLRFSERQKSAILKWAKAMGAKKVPSLYALKKVADQLKELVGNPTTKYESAAGNIFYLNDVGKAVAKVRRYHSIILASSSAACS